MAKNIKHNHIIEASRCIYDLKHEDHKRVRQCKFNQRMSPEGVACTAIE